MLLKPYAHKPYVHKHVHKPYVHKPFLMRPCRILLEVSLQHSLAARSSELEVLVVAPEAMNSGYPFLNPVQTPSYSS